MPAPIKEELDFDMNDALYDYSGEPLYQIFLDQEPEYGTLTRTQVRKALLACKIDVEGVIMAFDEMDQNKDQLVTYEEFHYYVSKLPGYDMSELINVNNLNHLMSRADQ